MAAEYLANSVQSVALNAPIIFTASIPCRNGYIYHEDETGIFILRGMMDGLPEDKRKEVERFVNKMEQ